MLGWLKRKSKTEKVQALPEPADKVILHGHDLSKWNYLGYTECHFIDENKTVTGRYPIFLFVDKNNEKRRSYFLSAANPEYVETRHTYVSKSLKPWAAGEGNIYQLINTEQGAPSDYLREYMLERFNAEWDPDTHWWGTSDKAKYTSAQNKQKREKKPKTETESGSNVVTVEFGKQA